MKQSTIFLRYALPIYKVEFINGKNAQDLQFSISDDLLLEMLLMELRNVTIKFSSSLKRATISKEKQLIKSIESLENENPTEKGLHELEEKKSELCKIREYKLKGEIIRSRIQWVKYGEKPTKFFCHLERKNFLDKTIKKINLDNGKFATTQNEILDHVKLYYQNLFKSRDSSLSDADLDRLLKKIPINKLEEEKDNCLLEGSLTISELGEALKNMKHNKTPGIDGFPAEFLKVFWGKLKFLVARVLNYSYDNGKLPISLRQSIISCIPKGDKPREFLKNWRPISLLSVLYKVMSAALVNRTKKVLDKLISDSQTGFIKGRYIGESIRLVYDIINYCDTSNKTGLLMLIDFEKAFDSISWKFIYKVLEFFKFPDSYIKWIKLLNTSSVAAVMQVGVKSDFLKIERGCKQGDPIAPYLFILCGQIMCYMIKYNNNIKGIFIGENEFKITQFADDTTLF